MQSLMDARRIESCLWNGIFCSYAHFLRPSFPSPLLHKFDWVHCSKRYERKKKNWEFTMNTFLSSVFNLFSFYSPLFLVLVFISIHLSIFINIIFFFGDPYNDFIKSKIWRLRSHFLAIFIILINNEFNKVDRTFPYD